MIDDLQLQREVGDICRFRYCCSGEPHQHTSEYHVAKADQYALASDVGDLVIKGVQSRNIPVSIGYQYAVDNKVAQRFAKVEVTDEVVEGLEELHRILIVDADIGHGAIPCCPNKIVEERDADGGVDLQT